MAYNLVGSNFDRLTVLEKIKGDKTKSTVWHRKASWLCKCLCGKTIITKTQTLLNGEVKSCGCYRIEQSAKNHKKLRPYESLYNVLVKSAKERKIFCSLSYDEFIRFTKTLNCHYCDVQISWQNRLKNKGGFAYNLDRIDNNKGYSLDNFVVCCKRCNVGKSNLFSYSEWKIMTTALKNIAGTYAATE